MATDAVTQSPQSAQCPGCGFTVSRKGEFCPACREKQEARPPSPYYQLGSQPIPASMRDATPRADDPDDEADLGTDEGEE